MMAEDKETATPIFVVEGRRYNITDVVETFAELEAILNETILEVGDKSTETQRIIERVKAFMSTSLGAIRKEYKLKDKVKKLRKALRKRITDTQSIILELVEADPKEEDAVNQARKINTATVELQRLMLDETALTLLLRKDMTDGELTRDRELRAERQERVNRTLEKAMSWLAEIPMQEDGTELELSQLESEIVPHEDEEYDDSIMRIIMDQDEEDLVQLAMGREEQTAPPEIREVSPEPEKHPGDVTSTPKRSPFEVAEGEGGAKPKKRVSYETSENLETIWTDGAQKGSAPQLKAAQGNRVYEHPGYNPDQREGARGVPNLKSHEKQFYDIQNRRQDDVPIFPGEVSRSNLSEETIQPSVHKKDDSDLTKTLKKSFQQPGYTIRSTQPQ